MRRNFAQVLKSGKVDIEQEYLRLYGLFYNAPRNGNSVKQIISKAFISFPYRGTCISLDQFNDKYDFNFEKYPDNFDIDYLINFCEYIYNMVIFSYNIDLYTTTNLTSFFIEHKNKIIDSIGYMQTKEDNFTIFVPKDSVAIEVSESELIPDNVSYKLLSYNHHSNFGNISSKKDTLLKLADILEPKRRTLKAINNSLEDDLFLLINSCNIRHNNIEPNSPKYYKKYIADMSENELEEVYNNIYHMCLLAFMELEHKNNKDYLKELKNGIVNTTK